MKILKLRFSVSLGILASLLLVSMFSLLGQDPSSVAASPAANSGASLAFDYECKPRANFSKAAFKFWAPASGQPIRGVIVLVPGLNGDGRGMLNDGAWQALAVKYHLALVSCFMQGGDYHAAAKGTGDALLEALKSFSTQAGHPEIADAPLLLYGESAGGQFNYNFVLWKPERVMTFVVNKGAYYNLDHPSLRTCAVPGLFFLGMTDSDLRIKNITALWKEGRSRGALWALTPQPNSGHEFSKTAPVARVFFEAVLKVRLPGDSSSLDSSSPTMTDMQENQGWIGDLTSHDIHAGASDSDADRSAAWLPDETSANAWKAFVSNGG